MSHQLSIALSSAQNRRRPVRLHACASLQLSWKQPSVRAGLLWGTCQAPTDLLVCKRGACRSVILLCTSNQWVVRDEPEVQHRLVVAQVEQEQAADREKEYRVHVVHYQLTKTSGALLKRTLWTHRCSQCNK